MPSCECPERPARHDPPLSWRATHSSLPKQAPRRNVRALWSRVAHLHLDVGAAEEPCGRKIMNGSGSEKTIRSDHFVEM